MIRAWLLAALVAFPAMAEEVGEAPGGVVRLLDRLTGQLEDINLSRGQSATHDRLTVQLDDCRYPVADPASNAYAHLTIMDAMTPGAPVFAGWMVASSPALNALDHPRYDVWILHCDTPSRDGE